MCLNNSEEYIFCLLYRLWAYYLLFLYNYYKFLFLINRDSVRYQYTHEILSDGAPSVFSDKQIVRKRRVSIVMRNEPPVEAME